MIDRGTQSFEAPVTIELGDCTDLNASHLKFELKNVAACNDGFAGSDGEIASQDTLNITGICRPKSGDECVAAELHITGTCGCGGHQIDQTIQIKVPVMKGYVGVISYADLVFIQDAPPKFTEGKEHCLDDKMTMDIEKVDEINIEDIGAAVSYMLVLPVGSTLKLGVFDSFNTPGPIDTSLPFVIAGVDYFIQSSAFPAGGAFKAKVY
jgi:hypothetical protein